MDAFDQGPVELCFHNVETGHFSIFDTSRLRFAKKWQAIACVDGMPHPPIGLAWLYVIGTQDDVTGHGDHIDMEVLLAEVDICACAAEDATCEIVLMNTATKRRYRMFHDERSLFRTEAGAKLRMEAGEIYSNTTNPYRPQFLFTVVPFSDGDMDVPVLWSDVQEDFFPELGKEGD